MEIPTHPRGVDLLALEAFMATFRDWFVICQASVPRVCGRAGGLAGGWGSQEMVRWRLVGEERGRKGDGGVRAAGGGRRVCDRGKGCKRRAGMGGGYVL